MTTLAIEGALGSFSVAIARDDAILAQRCEDGRQALELGLALVASAMREASLVAGDLERVAVGVGPGGFTGLRIALSYAKALALAWRLPLVAISSYDLLEGDATPPVLTVVHGRTGIVCARYRTADSQATACGAPRDVVGRLLPGSESLTLAGDAEDVREVLAERAIRVNVVPAPPVPAVALALLAGRRAPARSPHEVRPEYGELPAATLPRTRGAS